MRDCDSEVAGCGADIIASAFQSYVDRFRELTGHARGHFERRDWHAMQRDSVRRLDLYTESVTGGLRGLRALLEERLAGRPVWAALRAAYQERIASRGDEELAETFFNSITRRIFHTIGVDPAVEFVIPARPYRGVFGPRWTLSASFERDGAHADLYRKVLEDY